LLARSDVKDAAATALADTVGNNECKRTIGTATTLSLALAFAFALELLMLLLLLLLLLWLEVTVGSAKSAGRGANSASGPARGGSSVPLRAAAKAVAAAGAVGASGAAREQRCSSAAGSGDWVAAGELEVVGSARLLLPWAREERGGSQRVRKKVITGVVVTRDGKRNSDCTMEKGGLRQSATQSCVRNKAAV